MKSVLFLGHSNNDMDHYLPLMVRLKKNNEFNPVLFCMPSEKVLMKNKVHQFWVEESRLDCFSASGILFNSPLQRILFSVFSALDGLYAKFTNMSIYTKGAALKLTLIFLRKVVGFFKAPLHNILTHLVKSKKCHQSINEFFEANSVGCIVCDTAKISREESETELILKMRGIMLRFARGEGVPIFKLSHGVRIKYESAPQSWGRNHLEPNLVAVCNEEEAAILKRNGVISEDTEIALCGDLRLDVNWIRSLEESVRNFPNGPQKKGSERVLLYLVGCFNWLNDDELLNSLHRDICGLAKKIEGLRVWVKLHPRYPLHFPLGENRGLHVSIFGNDTDTTLLLPHADIVVSPFSGVLIHPMLMKRTAIFYDKIRPCIGAQWECLFDYTDSLIKAATPEELEEACGKILAGDTADFSGLEEFYKKYISGGNGFNQSIAESHERGIKKLCKV